MKILAIIPARYASTRFPGKPLVNILGKPMVVRVIEQALKCPAISKAIIATDNESIKSTVQSYGYEAVMTDENHQSGTDRCYEAYTNFGQRYDFVLNIQGDEPFIQPEQLITLCEILSERTQIATLVKPITEAESLFNPHIVKVVRAASGQGLYFSRATVPFLRDVPQQEWLNHGQYWHHLGVYAYKTDILKQITQLKPSPLEEAEKLEQLRWLEAGYQINTAVTEIPSIGIDTPQELQRALAENQNFYEGR